MSFADLGVLGNGGWRGALRIAQRRAPLRGEGSGKLGWGLPAEAGVGAFCVSIAAKIGCSAHTLNDWVKKAEVDSRKRAGFPTELADAPLKTETMAAQ